MAQNMCHSGFPIHHFVHNYMHNSITKGWYKDILPIEQLLYYRRYLFCWLELYARFDRQVTNPNTHRNHFRIRHFVRILTLVTRKLRVVCGRSTYPTTTLLLRISIFCVRAVCKIQMASYACKHDSQSLSDKPFLRRQCTWTQFQNFRSNINVKHIEPLLYK